MEEQGTLAQNWHWGVLGLGGLFLVGFVVVSSVWDFVLFWIDLILVCTYVILFIGTGIITASENNPKSYATVPKYQCMCPTP